MDTRSSLFKASCPRLFSALDTSASPASVEVQQEVLLTPVVQAEVKLIPVKHDDYIKKLAEAGWSGVIPTEYIDKHFGTIVDNQAFQQWFDSIVASKTSGCLPMQELVNAQVDVSVLVQAQAQPPSRVAIYYIERRALEIIQEKRRKAANQNILSPNNNVDHHKPSISRK